MGAARKIQGVAGQIGDDLHDVRTLEFFEALRTAGSDVLISTEVSASSGAMAASIVVGFDQRLVALHVDDGAAGQAG